MKLVRVFSNKNFTNIKFDEYFNVVLATIQDVVNKKDTHNLGKTSLVRVIDFLLLGDFSKKKGLLSNHIFSGQVFYLEILLNSGKYLVIRRSIDSATKISFHIDDIPLNNFVAPTSWDEEDVAFEKAKDKLNEYLGFDVVAQWPYRKSITYFLRTQQDYLDVFQLGKFKGKHSDWKPFVFDLLGFDGELLAKKYDLEEQIADKQKTYIAIKNEANVDPEEKDKILGMIDIKNQERETALSSIDKFNFYSQDKKLTKEIIEDLDIRIQAINTERYRINYQIKKNEDSLRQTIEEVNLEKLQELFDDTKLFFPNELKKQFQDLESFNKAISSERKKYLKENLEKLRTEFKSVDEQIRSLEEQKSEKLTFLTESDSYTKFKSYQKQLSIVESELIMLNEKLRLIDRSVEIQDEINKIKLQLLQSKEDIQKEIGRQKHAELRRIFNQIIVDVVGTNAIISIKQNDQGNVEFSAEYQNFQQISTSESDGTTYKKLLCAAFDMSLLIHYSSNSFFRFVYHDGIFEGLDDRIKVRLLDSVKSICQQYNIQYIVSMIDSDIPKMQDRTLYLIQPSEICLQLNDRDDSGKLFKQSF